MKGIGHRMFTSCRGAPRPPASRAKFNRCDYSVLCVEDDRSSRDAMAELLTLEGFSVRTASDGRAAWELFQRTALDLVVSDIRMPRLDGLDLCLRIQQSAWRCPVILLTGSVSMRIKGDRLRFESREDEARAAGACGLLEKPIDFDRLMSALDQSLAGASWSAGRELATTW